MTSATNQAAHIAAVIQNLEQANPLREPTLRAIIAALNLAPGSAGLDIGCGIGLQTLLLAEAIQPNGHVSSGWTFQRNCSIMREPRSQRHRWPIESPSSKAT